MTTLAYQYIDKLADYLASQALTDPIPDVTGGLFQVGKYQDDPTDFTFIATLHEGSPITVTKTGRQTWEHVERDDMDREMLGGGKCILYWWYRYSVVVNFFMVDSGENKETARRKGTEVVQWIRKKVADAQPDVLSLTTSSYGETPLEQRVTKIEMVESGGDSSYIEKSLILIEQSVMVMS